MANFVHHHSFKCFVIAVVLVLNKAWTVYRAFTAFWVCLARKVNGNYIVR